ncbi:Eqtn [Lemmus lemmus]
MDFLLFIFLFEVFLPDISNLQPSMKQDLDAMPSDEEQYYSDDKNEEANHVVRKPEENEGGTSANEKRGNYYKDVKHYVFTTRSQNDTGSEISVSATTDLKFAVKNSSTPNVPAFWTMLAKAINDTTVNMVDKDQFYQAIPASDLNTTSKDKLSQLEEVKIKLLLGISLMTLILLIPLLIFCFATLYKLRNLSDKSFDSQYTVNPELATLSYFHPSEGVSDTSYSKSADSSTQWGHTASNVKRSSKKKPKSKSMDYSADPDHTALNEEATTTFLSLEKTTFLPPVEPAFHLPEEPTFLPPEMLGEQPDRMSEEPMVDEAIIEAPLVEEQHITE